jgi:hypothetical protein
MSILCRVLEAPGISKSRATAHYHYGRVVGLSADLKVLERRDWETRFRRTAER